MPELPEVEVCRRYVEATCLRQRIQRVHVPVPEILDRTSPQALGRRLNGRRFDSASRHGKYLFVSVETAGALVLHFGMTGTLRYAEKPVGAPPYTACQFIFDGGSRLSVISRRKIGRVGLASSREAFVRDHDLGPDALALAAGQFVELAKAHRGGVKSWLMNQQVMAGIGNEYSDEVLFQAGIHPRRCLSELDGDALRQLLQTLRRVLKKAVAAGADPEQLPPGFLLPHRHEGGHCPACGATVQSIQIGGRRGWYCPGCQPDR